MTELEYVEIEGFKGLEYVEFEPTDINLITGRNNTGKTSFLESIELLLQPKSIEQYSEEIATTINVNQRTASIRGKVDGSEHELILKPPREDELGRAFVEIVNSSIESQISFLETALTVTSDPKEILVESESITRQVFQEEITPEDLEQLKNEFLIFEIDGTENLYFGGGEKSIEITKNVESELAKKLSEKQREDDEGSSLSSWSVTGVEYDSEVEDFVSSSPIRIRAGSTFVTGLSNPVKKEGSVRFLQSIALAESIDNVDDGDAIKIDDIGDYLRTTKIVEDLKTFTLDYLVFEEDGEKHQIPYEFMGDGFKSIVGLLWELMDDEVEDQIVLIEEPENHMHPGYVREMVYFLIDLAREEDVQLFITTHDSDFINDFFTENLTSEEEEYLEDEFSLLRMEEDSAVVEDYETARENLKDLHLDLRGI